MEFSNNTGFDDARLDTLFLALPVAWKGTLVQYTGRLHRLHPGKRAVQIFDYVDSGVPVLHRMFEKRLRGYRAIGYVRDTTAAGDARQGTRTSSNGTSMHCMSLTKLEATPIAW